MSNNFCFLLQPAHTRPSLGQVYWEEIERQPALHLKTTWQISFLPATAHLLWANHLFRGCFSKKTAWHLDYITLLVSTHSSYPAQARPFKYAPLLFICLCFYWHQTTSVCAGSYWFFLPQTVAPHTLHSPVTCKIRMIKEGNKWDIRLKGWWVGWSPQTDT